MFEKEAEEYREKGKSEGYYLVSQEMEQEELDYIIDESFKDGAELGYNRVNEELEEKISVLLSCKNCPENKDGLICQKEYENKCLAQKIQYIKELKEENAELKEKLKPENCLKLLAKEGYIKFTSDQLTKAKEIIEELYNIIPASMADYAKEPMEHARKFMTEE